MDNWSHSTYSDVWAKRARERDKVIKAGKCEITFSDKARFQVICKSTEQFRLRALTMGGVWKPRSGTWRFRAVLSAIVIKMCCELFPGKVTVRPHKGTPYKPSAASLEGDLDHHANEI